MRHTSSHTKNRRSHHALDGVRSFIDKESGNRLLPHRLDEATGMYRGKVVVPPRVKKEKAGKTGKREAKREQPRERKEEKVEGSKGIMGKIAAAARPKARSGMGGGV